MVCNYYPMDPIACISKTEGIMCQFSVFDNACLAIHSTNFGCIPQLNKMACLNQLTNSDGSEARCYFGQRCMDAQLTHLMNLGCSQQLSRNSCTNVIGKDCFWNGNECKEAQSRTIEIAYCSEVYKAPVTASLCSKIKGINCMSSQFEGDYGCINVKDEQIQYLKCNTPGLNEDTCVRITGQKCIFKNMMCYESNEMTECNDSVNKELCLSVENANLTCRWYNNRCQVAILKETMKCEDYTEVNPTVCAKQKGLCQYKDGRCIIPKKMDQSCSDLGLSKESCLEVKDDYCQFIDGQCKRLENEQLNHILCNNLNEDACVNVTTQFQFCKWTGLECVTIFINQDLDCPILNVDKNIKYNGNVCRAISKPGVRCKYNKKKSLCEKSIDSDDCTTSYLNLNGCTAIQGMACKWTDSGCVVAQITQEITSCLDLGFANQVACSQVLKSDEDGCYFDIDAQQCRLVNEQLLKQIQCTGMGLSRIACAQVITTGQICRWYNNQCQQIKTKQDVSQVFCLQMQYVNPAACALVDAGKEVCRYEQIAKGCVNSLDTESMTCTYPGLNAYACAQIQLKSCYYDKIMWQCKQIQVISANYLTRKLTEKLLLNSDCINSSPTPDVCRSITKIGQKCTWLFRESRCSTQFITFNESCLDYNSAYTGKSILINPNVCASIEMELPEYDAVRGPLIDKMKGYCIYEGGNCNVFKAICATPCCTEFIGINSHVCGRFSTGKYCYFSNELKCTELTMDVVDITVEKQVKDFYNSQQLKCSSMNKNSCHMIEWSTQQHCYFNGNLCVNINFNLFPNLNIFTEPTQILNKYACLSIEAMISTQNTVKYFGYQDKHCISDPTIIDLLNCESTELNSNACQVKYTDIYCRWNKQELKCKNVDAEYASNLHQCDQYLNEYGCVRIQKASCFFSYLIDKCIDAPRSVSCGYFGSLTGKVSRLACMNINLDGQICGYDEINHVCVDILTESDNCDLTDGNSIACYSKTKGDCRWNDQEMYCYENDQPIDKLGCEDNVSKELCLKIVSEPCEWNFLKMRCIKVRSAMASMISPDNLYNAEACAQVFGAPFRFDKDLNKCIQLTDSDLYKPKANPTDPLEPNIFCDGTQILNVDACLFSTLYQKCYFDKTQIAEKRCQTFLGVQTSCESPYLISLQMCTEVPQSCYFVKSTYECKYIRIDDSMKCSQLRDQQADYLFNIISCASINYDFQEYIGELQCQKSGNPDKEPDQQFIQQCRAEKYCKWDSDINTCQIMALKDLEWKQELRWVTNKDGFTYEQLFQWCEDTPIVYKADDCRNIFSKGVCLQLSSQCVFDLTMGGCYNIENNEQQILSCENIIGTNCLKSRNPNAPCIIDNDKSVEFPKINTCSGFPNKEEQICKQTAPSKCKDAQDLGSVSPIVCSRVSDNCYYDGTKCSSDTKKKKCNETFSYNACLSNGCDFTLGYCQQKFALPQFNQDSPFFLYQCQYINKLTIKAVVKRSICAQMNFPCAFQNELCVSAAQVDCSSLTQLYVSLQTCIYCLNGAYTYDSITYQCNPLLVAQQGCDNTNKYGCLSMTTDKNCAWTGMNCVEQSNDDVQLLTDCSLTNSYGCPKIKNACWVSPQTKLCSIVDIYSDCSLIRKQNGNQQACIISNQQSCQWLNEQCEDYPLDSMDCSKANKFGCLNLNKVSCGWSEQEQKCYEIESKPSISKCSEFFNSNKNLVKFNSRSCQQITGLPCFRDRTLRCNSIGVKDKPICEATGLNYLGCIIYSTGYCQFIDGQCVTIKDLQKVLCTSPINKVACFSLSLTCKFENNECSDYDVSSFTTIAELTTKMSYPYSPSVCKAYQELEGQTLQLFYDEIDGYCVDANQDKPFIYSCNTKGLNEITCLKQTKSLCQYSQNQCLDLSTSDLKKAQTCDPTFNWNACASIKLKCKFYQNKCQSVRDSETCISLAGIIVSPLTCSSRSSNTIACLYDNETHSCITSNDNNFSCTQNGLNQYGCQMNTQQEFCRFNDLNSTCIVTYETNLNCQHLTNKNKCLFIKTPKQYCKFDNGCISLEPTQVIDCYNLTPTNPMTCTAAETVACKYDKTTQTCVSVPDAMNTDEPWSNVVSFNQAACMKYQTANTQVIYTTDGCIIVDPQSLSDLTCDQPVNQFACSQITNPTQYCIYQNYKCQYKLPSQITVKSCLSIGYVNRQEFCEQADDVPCKFNSYTKQCEQIDIVAEPLTACVRGINKIACDSVPICQFDQFCLEITASCTGGSDCVNVKVQPCKIVNNNCILATDLDTLQCQQVANKLACISITTSEQYCRFSSSQCSLENLDDFKQSNCETIVNINSPYFCEQPTDIPCRYNQFENRCIESLSTDNFDCIRGLNEYACLNNTKQDLRCRFADFCYGPTQPMFDCDQTIFDCCNKAPNKNTCLLQDILKCQWNGNQCIKYDTPITTCNLNNTSKLTCLQSVDSNCVFNLQTSSCLQILQPTSCDQLQSEYQCRTVQILPCVWQNDSCKYHQSNAYELCRDIANLNGSQRACLNVIRSGQMCQFKDGICQSYNHTTDECLDNINKIACISQTTTKCLWKTHMQQIKIIRSTDPIEVEFGSCKPYIPNQNQICNDKLSYLSCLSITTLRQFCKWFNGQCVQISETNQIVTPTTHLLVNVNACALINSVPVYYSPLQALCIPLKEGDQISCLPPTPGLNMKACLSITKQTCKWNFNKRQCEYSQSQNYRHL
ncbi:unnamed protein product [Paramecium pentaurelia]|uniref:Uncharacterized protein n=1 Tax=Paramecium pentaurelia TaxID=43138 RepID=A0A8S1TLI1_9CILI|nr:unnamed protein product [Paramecium pentaurelia]